MLHITARSARPILAALLRQSTDDQHPIALTRHPHTSTPTHYIVPTSQLDALPPDVRTLVLSALDISPC